MVSRFAKFCIVLICLSQSAYSQDDYCQLQSQGLIPKDFITLSSDKYKRDKASIDKHENRERRVAKDEFYLKSNFGVDEILRSGKVIFNDTISTYLNAIKDEILKDQPTLKSQIRIYVSKSSAVNAFATNNGIILVNLGLIAKLESEAQLAYILCHEITHYIKQHTINEYIENKQIEEGKDEYQSMNSHEKELASCRYSKEMEMEADLEGLTLFNKTAYSSNSLPGVFTILKFSELPYGNMVFPKSYFNTPYLKIPEYYFLYKVDSIVGDTSTNFAKSTHPGIEERKKEVLSRIPEKDSLKDKDFIVSKNTFLWARNKARLEICRLLLLNCRYEAALYQAFLLLNEQDSKHSLYLRKTIAKALYAISKYKSVGQFDRVHLAYDNVQGELKNVSYLFDKLDTPESLVIAIHYLWKLREEYPADIEVVLMSDDLLSQLVKAQELKMSDFEQAYVADSLQVTVDSTSQLSEMTPIKMEWKYAFVDLLKSTAFRETFARYEKEHSDYKNRTDRERRVELLAAAKANKQLQNRGYRLGIKHVVMVDPFYARINTLKKEAYRFQFTEGKKAKYSAMIRKTGDKIGVKTETLSPVDFVQTEVAQMNDYAALEEWVRERLEHEDFFKKTGFISPIHSEVQLIAKRHGTNHFGWSGLVWYSQKNKMAQKLLLWSIIYPFMLPVATYELTHPEHFTLHFTLLYDVSTGVESMHYVKAQRTKDLRKFTSAAIYYTFLQIKKAPKHK